MVMPYWNNPAYSTEVQTNAPNQGGPGNPGGANNTSSTPGWGPRTPAPGTTPQNAGGGGPQYGWAGFQGYGPQYGAMYPPWYNTYSGQQPYLGRYQPPMMNDGNQYDWMDRGGYSWNSPNSYGPSPFGFGNTGPMYQGGFRGGGRPGWPGGTMQNPNRGGRGGRGGGDLPPGYSYQMPTTGDRMYTAVEPPNGGRWAYGPDGDRIEVGGNQDNYNDIYSQLQQFLDQYARTGANRNSRPIPSGSTYEDTYGSGPRWRGPAYPGQTPGGGAPGDVTIGVEVPGGNPDIPNVSVSPVEQGGIPVNSAGPTYSWQQPPPPTPSGRRPRRGRGRGPHTGVGRFFGFNGADNGVGDGGLGAGAPWWPF